ncbi:hypothetical protein BDD43_2825 [Mucilaginibacter gracilis]|uniref:Uncharacterized protein n=1 Tax=Mucilaginibacter gracilis TaxID=423350 RepID=A0A495J0Z4_9SPHI|nr:hypothetical protein [Mucilaginibacter gracilis]RKR82640.1 hypothetical protein BDD43_2825 [Mucilaginibacter gracilis]
MDDKLIEFEQLKAKLEKILIYSKDNALKLEMIFYDFTDAVNDLKETDINLYGYVGYAVVEVEPKVEIISEIKSSLFLKKIHYTETVNYLLLVINRLLSANIFPTTS